VIEDGWWASKRADRRGIGLVIGLAWVDLQEALPAAADLVVWDLGGLRVSGMRGYW
jgi:hypothetical protein